MARSAETDCAGGPLGPDRPNSLTDRTGILEGVNRTEWQRPALQRAETLDLVAGSEVRVDIYTGGWSISTSAATTSFSPDGICGSVLVVNDKNPHYVLSMSTRWHSAWRVDDSVHHPLRRTGHSLAPSDPRWLGHAGHKCPHRIDRVGKAIDAPRGRLSVRSRSDSPRSPVPTDQKQPVPLGLAGCCVVFIFTVVALSAAWQPPSRLGLVHRGCSCASGFASWTLVLLYHSVPIPRACGSDLRRIPCMGVGSFLIGGSRAGLQFLMVQVAFLGDCCLLQRSRRVIGVASTSWSRRCFRLTSAVLIGAAILALPISPRWWRSTVAIVALVAWAGFWPNTDPGTDARCGGRWPLLSESRSRSRVQRSSLVLC